MERQQCNICLTRNLSSHIDVHTHALSTLHNRVTLTFWSQSQCLPYSLCVPSLVLIARRLFWQWTHRQTHKHTEVTEATDHPSHASATDGMGNKAVKTHELGHQTVCTHFIVHPWKTTVWSTKSTAL